MMHHTCHLVVAAALASGLSAQITMTHLLEVDVANVMSGIGNDVTAVAWNGTDLFVAGYNGTTAVQSVAINKLTDVFGAATWGAPFGVQAATPAQRGYINLDWDLANSRLAAGYDSGASSPDGLSLWDANGTQLWIHAGRGSSGVAADAGFPGGNLAFGAGTAWARFGTGGRALQDAIGSDIWDFTTGMPLNVAGQGSFLRDIAVDRFSGDIYVRSSNNVFKGTRTGDNACTMSLLVDATDADLVNQQNLCVVNASGGTVILWNNRNLGSAGQNWTDVIKAVRADGSPDVIDWGTFMPATGFGAYDFSYDIVTNTVAISDFASRKVQIFSVSVPPYFAYGAGCAGQGGFVPRLSASGVLTPAGGTLNYNFTDVAPLSLGLLGLGLGPTNLPLGNGCSVLVDQVQIVLGPIVTGPGGPGSGVGTVPIALPGGFSGFLITAQGVVLENGGASSLVWTNGVSATLP